MTSLPELDALDARDRALAVEIVLGTVQRRNTLDAVLAAASTSGGSRTPAAVRQALRMSVFQLLFLDRVPAHAAVSDGVELAKRSSPRAAAYANAVLRRIAADGGALLTALTDGSDVRSLSLRYSHPEWLVRLWLDELGGEEAAALMEADNRAPERALRVSRLRATTAQARASLAGDGIEAGDADGFPDALIVESGPAVETSTAFREGLVTPQSRGAQLVGHVVAGALPSGRSFVELCAAPGGKLAHVAALLQGWELTAVDDDPARVEVMERNLSRLGVGDVTVLATDAAELPAELDGTFDVVLLDAPCTGLGTLASRADLRWRRRAGDVQRLAALQGRLLAAAARLVAPSGALVYSVCTITLAETLGVIDALVTAGGWALDDLGSEWPAFAHPRNAAFLQTLPSRDRTSGFFVARLRRVS